LGETQTWTANNRAPLVSDELKTGLEVFKADPQYGAFSENDSWIITDVLGDGKFKAVPKQDYEDWSGYIFRSQDKETIKLYQINQI
jgi:hypothetical protein